MESNKGFFRGSPNVIIGKFTASTGDVHAT